MIANFARWMIRKRLNRLANLMLTSSSFLIGKGTRIYYNKNGYWRHAQKGWVINEAYPNIRLDIKKLEEFNSAVYFHEYRPSNGDVIVDLGAGIGTESIFISKLVGPQGKVYAIEAAADTYALLQANVADNNLGNVHSFNIAISDHRGKLSISASGDTHINNSIFEGKGTEVEAFTMDEFLAINNIDRINYLKVNIEGAEKLMVRAFDRIDSVEHVAISCHDFLAKRNNNPVFATKEIITQFLVRNNFEISSRKTGIDYEDDWIYGRNTRNN